MRYVLFICLSFCFILLQAQDPINSSQREIVFRSVNVIPMDQERIIEKQDVVVKNGMITAIGKTGYY
jgi:urease alpha subunit